MKPYQAIGIALLPLYATVLGFAFSVSSGSTLSSTFNALASSAFSYAVYSVLPLSLYVFLAKKSEIRLTRLLPIRVVALAVATQTLLHLGALEAFGTVQSILVAQVVSSAIFFLVLVMRNRASEKTPTAPKAGMVSMGLLAYLGLVPLVYSFIPALAAAEAADAASILSYALATTILSTDLAASQESSAK